MPIPEIRRAAASAAVAAESHAGDAAIFAAHAANSTRAAGAVGAAARAVNAPFAAAGAAADAAYADTELEPGRWFDHPLWSEPGEPDWLVDALKGNANILDSGPEWSFWREGYQGFLIGKPLDWELQREVALIPDAEWQKGPERIAELIEAIRKEHDRPVLGQKQLAEQAQRLTASPRTTQIVAVSTADAVEAAIREFMLAESLNVLPDSLTPLHRIPHLLRSMGENAQSNERTAELEKQIAELTGEVARLTRELEKEKASSYGQLAKETFVKTTVQIATVGFWGTLVSGIGHMTGIVDVGTMLERLSAFGHAPPSAEQLVPRVPMPPVDI